MKIVFCFVFAANDPDEVKQKRRLDDRVELLSNGSGSRGLYYTDDEEKKEEKETSFLFKFQLTTLHWRPYWATSQRSNVSLFFVVIAI